jgi:hypothetical protein
MNFGIECNGRLIARFEHGTDRNTCLAELLDAYEDEEFLAVDLTKDARDENKTEPERVDILLNALNTLAGHVAEMTAVLAEVADSDQATKEKPDAD